MGRKPMGGGTRQEVRQQKNADRDKVRGGGVEKKQEENR